MYYVNCIKYVHTVHINAVHNVLLEQLAATEAVLWSPQTDSAAVQALSELLIAAKGTSNA
ncbi:MAG: hypothetical protein EWV53_22185 [Microcystis panniformis Mp_MB_F_20051200_S9]|uniref:Uncharacterized protein n=1 Tax=Microcystis panniformis Mp_MB_F_20051200_S9 TaxID=2486223 RepID=A0A552PIK0_9CHRO|nr:MAG: hypothetical protein EWV43_22130 [Microcystis panniformis Mp_MB_F_20080800_S26D]TRV49290.1 MAG: hypothetical protein EWV87_10520 [Microcystis panniformis Mp_GB_SS_20050300_S99]TRV51845.1 MAG: hypothetical protein EWV42_08945 [Microcystis panniformis Mp_GB_SS_20050300_S99D]TRV53863.1 MAG: hypothetical protein EWV69_23300 [Microcystis panniformis Mp_MB_F_20080800_S26]TRV56736.1 MAG: hypothetical protein EWV53_22185 [Microcystis panniformis Mp_MB_F_20051200_S9]TRV65499.1 MAG: hypothetical